MADNFGFYLSDDMDENLDFDLSWHVIQRTIEYGAAFKGILPPCVLSKTYECYGCIAEGLEKCPVGADVEYQSYLLFLRDSFVEHETKRTEQIKILKKVLKRHKLPMHWEYIALLAIKEAPELFVSPQSVRGLIFFNTDVFKMSREGVFTLVNY